MREWRAGQGRWQLKLPRRFEVVHLLIVLSALCGLAEFAAPGTVAPVVAAAAAAAAVAAVVAVATRAELERRGLADSARLLQQL